MRVSAYMYYCMTSVCMHVYVQHTYCAVLHTSMLLPGEHCSRDPGRSARSMYLLHVRIRVLVLTSVCITPCTALRVYVFIHTPSWGGTYRGTLFRGYRGVCVYNTLRVHVEYVHE